MKTLRLLGMALVAVVMCGNFTACSSDDDEEDEISTSFEGTWYLSSEKWYGYKEDGTPDLSTITYMEEYPYHSQERIWTFTKKSNGTYQLNEYPSDATDLITINKNTFRDGEDRFSIKEVISNQLVVEYIDHYFDYFDNSGNLINTNTEDMMENLEYGFYTFTR